MTFNSFMNSIGDAFKKGWNNGNLAKGISLLGATTFTVGLTGAAIHDMNKNRCFGSCGSIWSFRPPYNPMNYMMGMNLLQNSMLIKANQNNLYAYNGMGGLPFVSSGFQYNPYGGMNNFYSITGGMNPYQYGQMLMQQTYAQMQNTAITDVTGAIKQNNEYAGEWKADQSTEAGEQFDNALKGMNDSEGNPIEGKTFKISDAENATEYRQDLSELGKSYAAYIEKTSGNGDRLLNEEEYIKFELSQLPSDATEEQKANIKLAGHYAFSRIDLNKDGKADWKEIAAAIATFDTNNKDKLDGQVTSTDAYNISSALGNPNDPTFSQKIIKNYKHLFGNNE